MASVTVETRNGRTLYRIEFRDKDKRRRKIRLGAIAQRDAKELAIKVTALVSASISGGSLPPTIAHWVASIGDDLHAKLADAELVNPRLDFTLGEWVEQYLKKHLPTVGEHCQRNLERSKEYLLEFIDKQTKLSDITADDAQAYRDWLKDNKGLAQATIAQHIKKAKQFFLAAVKTGSIGTSPFIDVVAGTMANDERSVYVSAETIEKAIAMAPDAQWRLIIALSRYAGLRCPSEVLRLRWQDVDFVAGTITIYMTKTAKQGKAKRVVPILPELRKHLEEAFNPEDDRCISRYQTSNLNLRKVFLEIIAKAKLSPWPRLFHNLRGSLQTDLSNRFPSHVVTAWLGNSEKVAQAHYLKVTGDHIAEACSRGVGQQVGTSSAESNAIKGKPLPDNPTKTKATAKTQCSAMALNTPSRNHIDQQIATANDMGGAAGGDIGSLLSGPDGVLLNELLELWNKLPTAERIELIESLRIRIGAGGFNIQ